MEVTVKKKYDVTVKAVLRNEELSVNVQVNAFYGDGMKSAGVSEDITDKKVLSQIQEALEQFLEGESFQRLVQKSDVAASEALIIATRRGEIT